MRHQVRPHAAVGEIEQVKPRGARGQREIGNADKIPIADAALMLLKSGERPPQQVGLYLAVDAFRPPGTQLSPTGPVSIVLSQASHLIVVYRNGIEIGRARLTVAGDTPLVNHALVLTDAPSTVPDPYVPDPTKFSWLRIGVPGHIGEQGTQVDPNAVARIKMPADFAARVNGILAPGATLFVTNEPLYPQTSGPMLQVVDADPPAKRQSAHSHGS